MSAKWFILSAAVASLVATAAVLGLGMRDSGAKFVITSGSGARVVVAVPDESSEVGYMKVLKLFDPSSDQETQLGEADAYGAVRWSPDGRTIAALTWPQGPDDDARVHLFDTSTFSETVQQVPSDAIASQLAWSPDSTRLAVIGRGIYTLSVTGEVLGSAVAPAAEGDDPSDRIVFSGGGRWSEDSSMYVSIVNDVLIAIDRAGQSTVTRIAGLTGAEAGAASHASAYGFSERGFLIRLGSDPPSAFAISFTGLTPSASEVPEDSLPLPLPPNYTTDDAAADVIDRYPGEDVQLLGPTAGGTGDLFVVHVKESEGRPTIVVRARSTGAIFTLAEMPFDLRNGGLLDAFITGG